MSRVPYREIPDRIGSEWTGSSVEGAMTAGCATASFDENRPQEKPMTKFMDVHSGFVGVTAQQLKEAHERDLAIEADESVHFEHAWLDPESGKVFCLASGPSREAVLRIHERAGHPASEIYEVAVEVA
jgi:Protein of unknown function (DUF4242)